MKKLLLAIALILPFCGFSQDLDFGVTGGIALYSGDLTAKEIAIYANDFSWAGGIFLRNRFSRFVGFRAGLTLGKIRGDELINSVNIERGLNFQSNITEFSLLGEINLFHVSYPRNRTVISPYIAFGVAFFTFNPKINYKGQLLELRPLGTEGQGLSGYPNRYSRGQFSIPFGGGVNILINDQLTLGAEMIFRSTLTDYLDDISSSQVKYGDIFTRKGELSAAISNPLLDPTRVENLEVTYRRGGPHNDWYIIPALTLSWRIKNTGKSKSVYSKFMECPRF